jgi:arginine decarboxylase
LKQSANKKSSNGLVKWSIDDSSDTYLIKQWGQGFFGINGHGNVEVTPFRTPEHSVDLKTLIDDLVDRGIELPILVRFSDILKNTVGELNGCFQNAIKEFEYGGDYRSIYPIKVNQQCQVVEDIVNYGSPCNMGLEAGSKAELLIAVSMLQDQEMLLICNGYKDKAYIKTALQFNRIGCKVILVIEKLSELLSVIRISKEMNVRPMLGIRMKLSTISRGNWEASSGDKSKFGLFVGELMEAIRLLKENDLLDCFRLLHTHIGSQITSIRPIKSAMNEFGRIYVELRKMNIPVEYFDVGGGLGVDYDGSRSNYASSMNYTMQEYANDVVSAISTLCTEAAVAHPVILTESGRALVAHHSILVFNVLGCSQLGEMSVPQDEEREKSEMIRDMISIYKNVSLKNYSESYHDALQTKEESLTFFNVGLLTLTERAQLEKLFWGICRKVISIIQTLDHVPEEFANMEKLLSDIYFGNFSIFQSAPDHWAIHQLFPVMPIHRLDEEPSRNAIICDITCDSDGKIDKFIDLRNVREVLPVHPLKDSEKYYMGLFLVGAYQETLGDLHNLFGDTNAVHVSIHPEGRYILERVIGGDTVEEVIKYVQFNKQDMVVRVRNITERALDRGMITVRESREIMDNYEKRMKGSTYLTD